MNSLWKKVGQDKKEAEKQVKSIFKKGPNITTVKNSAESLATTTNQLFKRKRSTSTNTSTSTNINTNTSTNNGYMNLSYFNNVPSSDNTLDENSLILLRNYIKDKELNDNKIKNIISNIIKRENNNLSLNHELHNSNQKDELKKLQNYVKTERYILSDIEKKIKKLDSSNWLYKSKSTKKKISNYKNNKTIKEKNIEKKVKKIKNIVEENGRKKFRNVVGITKNQSKEAYERIKADRQNIVKSVKPINFRALKKGGSNDFTKIDY